MQLRKNTIPALAKSDAFSTIKSPAGFRSSYYKYPLILDTKIDKAAFTKRLFEDFGVETGNIFYPPCHMQGVYKKLGAFTYADLTVAEQVLAQNDNFAHACWFIR